MTFQMITLQRDSLQLQAQLEGPEHGELVILVHGFPDTPHSWDAVANGLVQAGYRVIRPWLRGYSADSVNSSAAYDPYNAGLDLLAWRKLFDGQRQHLVGHDWGAIAAMVAVATDPTVWKSLSLLAIPPFQRIERAWRLLPRQLCLSRYMVEMQSLKAPARIVDHDFARLRELWAEWSPDWQFTAADFAPVQQAFSQPGVAWAATRYYRSLFTVNSPATRAMYALSRKSLNVPTLALVGQNDGCMQAALLPTIVEPACFPAGIQALILKDCGHFLQLEQPTAVLKELLTLYRDTDFPS